METNLVVHKDKYCLLHPWIVIYVWDSQKVYIHLVLLLKVKLSQIFSQYCLSCNFHLDFLGLMLQA